MDDDYFVDSLPVATHVGKLQPEVREINADLAEVTNTPYDWPLAGYEAICECLQEHGIDLPLDISGEKSSDELVFALKDKDSGNMESPDDDQLYLYICYEENEEGKFEFYAEIVTETELHDLLDEFDENDSREESEDDDDE